MLFRQDNEVTIKKKNPPRKSQSWNLETDMDALYASVDKKSKYKAMLSSKADDRHTTPQIPEQCEQEEEELNSTNHTSATTGTASSTAMIRKMAQERCRNEKRRPSATALSSTALSQLSSFNSLAAPRKRETPVITVEAPSLDEIEDLTVISDDEDVFIEDETIATATSSRLEETTQKDKAECDVKTLTENDKPRDRPATKLKKKPPTTSNDEANRKKKKTIKKKRSTVSSTESDHKASTSISRTEPFTKGRSLRSSNSTSEKSQSPSVTSSSENKRSGRRASKSGTSSSPRKRSSSSAMKKPRSNFLAEVAAAMNASDSKLFVPSLAGGNSVSIKKKKRPGSGTSGNNVIGPRIKKNGRQSSDSSGIANAPALQSEAVSSSPVQSDTPASFSGANPQTPSHSSDSNHSRSTTDGS
jgi:hypothetical protein